MPLTIIQGDIVTLEVDAIVNAANESLLGGGGVDGAIHRAAGPELLEECKTLGGCRTGKAKITKGYNLPAKYVIHTVGPVWQGGSQNERQYLSGCYVNSLKLAVKHSIKTIAFPLISAGVYGYPKEAALIVAMQSIREFLRVYDLEVSIVIYQKGDFFMGKDERKLLDTAIAGIKARGGPQGGDPWKDQIPGGETFQEQLMRRIRETEITEDQAFKRANVDRRTWASIYVNRDYLPKKNIVMGFATALELSMVETERFLQTAGYTLTSNQIDDVIYTHCIQNGIADIDAVNRRLFYYDQKQLGVV